MKTVFILMYDGYMGQETLFRQSSCSSTGSVTARWDNLGIVASTLCLVHCAALPLCLAFLPTAISGLFAHNDYTHMILAFWVVLFSCLAIVPKLQKRPDRLVTALMLSGVALVLFCTFFEHLVEATNLELPIMTVGNLLVVVAHWLNKKRACC